jgi:paraquat-inducible protein B
MRAQLRLQSIVTGQLQIQLDFHPTLPPAQRDTSYEFPEMPTAQSSLAELTERLESLSIEEMFANVQDVVAGLKNLLESPDLAGTLEGMNHGIREMRQLIATTQEQIDQVSDRLDGTLGEADTTLASVRATMATARAALDTANESLAGVSEDSSLHYELRQALNEVTAAAKSVRVLADFLERNPDALVRGKRELK